MMTKRKLNVNEALLQRVDRVLLRVANERSTIDQRKLAELVKSSSRKGSPMWHAVWERDRRALNRKEPLLCCLVCESNSDMPAVGFDYFTYGEPIPESMRRDIVRELRRSAYEFQNPSVDITEAIVSELHGTDVMDGKGRLAGDQTSSPLSAASVKE